MQNSAVAVVSPIRRGNLFVFLVVICVSMSIGLVPGWANSAVGEVSGGGSASVVIESSTSPLSIVIGNSSGVVGSVCTVTATLSVPSEPAKLVQPVTFEILSGPNTDKSGISSLDANNMAVFNYTGSGGAGTDLIRAYCDVVDSRRAYSNVISMEWVVIEGDCNGNQINDSDEIAEGLAEDCNENGIPDECDIRDATSLDCNLDGIPDECGVCPPVDLIFVMDTSGSMSDESDALCANMAAAASDLAELGITVYPRFLGITDTYFACLEDYVTNLIGTSVPGSSSCGTDIQTDEDWGPAVAALSERYPWTPGNVRLIVPISDEGPCRGNLCEDPGTDRDSITNAINIAVTNNCFVSTIIGTGATDCVITLAQDLAAGTRGTTFISTNPADEFAQAIFDVVTQACQQSIDCNGNGIPDECDISSGYSEDANNNGVPDECEAKTVYKVLNKAGAAFNVGNVSPFWDLQFESVNSVAMAGTSDCDGLVILDEKGLLYRYGSVSDTLTGQDYGLNIARDVEVTPAGDGAYVLSGYGTVEAFGEAPHFGSCFFGSFIHPFDAARDLDLVYGTTEKASGLPSGGDVSGYYILNCLGQVKTFGYAMHLGEANFGYDIARALEVAPNGTGYLILDGYGQVHGFGSMEQIAADLATQNPFFALDLARDLEITPTGAGWHILDGYGNIISVGDAIALDNSPLVSQEDVYTDLERCGSGADVPPVVGGGGAVLVLKHGQAETYGDKDEAPTYALESSSSSVTTTVVPETVSVLEESSQDEASSSSRVTVRYEGKSSLVPAENTEQVISLVSALVQSCQGSVSEISASEWRKGRTGDGSLYLRFRTPITVLSASGKAFTVNALVVPMDSESVTGKVLMLSDPKGVGSYSSINGYDAASLKSLIEMVQK